MVEDTAKYALEAIYKIANSLRMHVQTSHALQPRQFGAGITFRCATQWHAINTY